MDWLADNWFLVLLIVAFIGMHFFMHGGHGGSSGDDDTDKKRKHRH